MRFYSNLEELFVFLIQAQSATITEMTNGESLFYLYSFICICYFVLRKLLGTNQNATLLQMLTSNHTYIL